MGAHSVLFTGGCRSGKSGLAQRWAESMGAVRVYVATSRTGDDPEMRARVSRHQAERGTGWVTVEPDAVSPNAPLDAAAALQLAVASVPPEYFQNTNAPTQNAADVAPQEASGGVILLDCVTLWLSDWLCREDTDDAAILRQVETLVQVLRTCPVPVALVTNEVGWGVAPDNAFARRFRDVAGLVNQRLAEICEGVVLAVSGLPLVVKGHVPPYSPRADTLQ